VSTSKKERMRFRVFKLGLFCGGAFLFAVLCYTTILYIRVGYSKRIAHAGGGINGDTYTNSIEALDHNIKLGFRFFELDFNWTADGKLVCVPDYISFSSYIGRELQEIPILEEFIQLRDQYSKYKHCTLDELAEWMEKNPRAILVTDVKKDNVKALDVIAHRINRHESRVIPQIYHPSEYIQTQRMGYKKIIWTLYRYNYSGTEDIINHITQMKLFALTMPIVWADEGLARVVSKFGLFTYVHTVNECSVLEHYQRAGIDEIYTDFLSPRKCHRGIIYAILHLFS